MVEQLTGRERFFEQARAIRAVAARRNISIASIERDLPELGKRWLGKASRGSELLSREHFDALLERESWSGSDLTVLRLGRLRSLLEHPSAAEDHQDVIPTPHPDHDLLDLVGIGALNYDHVIPKSVVLDHEVVDGDSGLSRGQEIEVIAKKESEIKTELKRWKDRGVDVIDVQLGGSTFNTISLLAAARIGLALGFIGVPGLPPAGGGPTHKDLLKDISTLFMPDPGTVDRRDKKGDGHGGRCVSAVHQLGLDAERHMLTWPGENIWLGKYILDNFWKVLDYLAAARVIHVTSLFDDDSAEVVATLLEVLHQRSPLTTISFDPGYVWCHKRIEPVKRILEVTRLLFLNNRELDGLVKNYVPGVSGTPDESEAVHSIRALLLQRSSIVVVKYPNSTTVYAPDGPEPPERPIPIVRSGPKVDIEDDTGAGDVFAAGYLAAQLASSASDRIGALLGMELAAAKLRHVGPPAAELLGSLAGKLELATD